MARDSAECRAHAPTKLRYMLYINCCIRTKVFLRYGSELGRQRGSEGRVKKGEARIKAVATDERDICRLERERERGGEGKKFAITSW